jgi:pyridoxal 5'-phosphate synthase glutaminase subunit Pdx2
MRIGVLALQGDFGLHARALEKCGVEAVEVRKPLELDEVDGLVMPGGESTTLLKLMDAWDFVPALEKFHSEGKPIFGTCAGLIILAREVESPKQFSLGLIDVTVERNAYGRQRESFEAHGTAKLDGQAIPLEMFSSSTPDPAGGTRRSRCWPSMAATGHGPSGSGAGRDVSPGAHRHDDGAPVLL